MLLDYRRRRAAGGTLFFTVKLNDRSATLLIDHIDPLRQAMRQVKARHPFDVPAMVGLPDHLPARWRLPADGGDYPLRQLDTLPVNPLKHGHGRDTAARPCSSLHRQMRAGVLPADWSVHGDQPWAMGDGRWAMGER